MGRIQNAVYILLATALLTSLNVFAQNYTNPIVSEDEAFEEIDGIVFVEAEYFYKQSKHEIRQWYHTSINEQVKVGRDEDPAHFNDAGNNSYLEILPDTRVTHDDVLTGGQNFSNTAGEMAILHYKVKINTPGKYYVWVRAYSTGTEDNGIHVGLNGAWPESGQRMQWCDGKNSWHWESKQRTEEVHCGEPYFIFLEIENAGIHEISFSMREDGFEFDSFLLTKTKNYTPKGKAPTNKN